MQRLTDNDRHFGPITIGKFKWSKAFQFYLYSEGGDEEDPGNRNALYIQAFDWRIRVALPGLIKPFIHKQKASTWDEETIERLGRDWYPQIFPRRYGISLTDWNYFSLYWGIEEGFGSLPDGVSERRKGWFLPFTSWRHVRHSYYDLDGKLFEIESGDLREQVPKMQFWFEDYDGEIILATTHIEEREWRLGERAWKFLSLFAKPKIRRTLEIQFSSEVGRAKGSWKGGTIGHGIDMLPGELHRRAFRRYCEQEHRSKSGTYSLKFLREKRSGDETFRV